MKIVLLDAGHGGLIDGKYVTPGKRSPIWEDGTVYYEGVGNRLIREELINLLKIDGIPFFLVNDGNLDLSLKERVSVVNQIAKKYGAVNVLLISIHSNAFNTESAHGWSCYTSKGQTKSDEYAEMLYKKMMIQFPVSKFRINTIDNDLDEEENFYLLKNSICPAILSENFFMTNEKECKEILMSVEGRKKIAVAHFEMIKHFYKNS